MCMKCFIPLKYLFVFKNCKFIMALLYIKKSLSGHYMHGIHHATESQNGELRNTEQKIPGAL